MSSKTAQKKGWKEIQSKKQINQKTKWALIILAIIFGLLIFGNIIKFIKTVFTPWQSVNSKRSYLVTDDFNINLIIKAQKISLLIFSPQNQKVVVLDIPPNAYLQLPKGFGNWQLSSVFDLGGDELLKITLVNFFGLPIDGFLLLGGKHAKVDTAALLDQLRKDPFALLSLLPSIKTNLTPFELIRLKMGLSSVRFDKIKQIDLANTAVFQKTKLADGSDVYIPDTVKLDSVLIEMVDPIIQSEHKTIAVFNSTSHIGLAQKAARLITNLGGNVIITGNGQNKLKISKVLGEKSKTLARLKQIFAADDTIGPNAEDVVSSRAQINIFLGEDYFE